MRLVAMLVIAALIIVHGTNPEDFVVDSTTVALLVPLGLVVAIPYLPLLSKYIAELNIMGTTIKFRQQIERAEEQLATVKKASDQARTAGQLSRHKAKDSHGVAAAKWPAFVNIGEHLYRLIEEDPKLAVAGLGIELEKVLGEAAKRAGAAEEYKLRSFRAAINALNLKKIIDPEQAALLMQLVDLRNLAVHGGEIQKDDAYRFFSIVDRLNESVSLGYSIDFRPNEDWEEQGLMCQFEHCIEHMPLEPERWDGSCRLFGHDCPGGPAQVKVCADKGLFDGFDSKNDENVAS